MKVCEFFSGLDISWRVPPGGLLFRYPKERDICLLTRALPRARSIDLSQMLGVVDWDLELLTKGGELLEVRMSWLGNEGDLLL